MQHKIKLPWIWAWISIQNSIRIEATIKSQLTLAFLVGPEPSPSSEAFLFLPVLADEVCAQKCLGHFNLLCRIK